ncbi:hypothetical protein E4U31_004491 [Claviceps sp. LM219 group G6]|nr:hypothetical protein E4U15_008280 [Claviceps sp. LM218 group G6]KAG6099209.1 hypothetical protein E4U31_004491 [Claviceps sp. LM219 group G6]KAG6106431.1 hypothetical protein E4U14_004601 [Claviceps sp. LM454 group G7]
MYRAYFENLSTITNTASQNAYNTSNHSTHGLSPAEVLRGYNPRGPSQVTRALEIVNEKAELRVKEIQDKHAEVQRLLSSTQAQYAKYYNRKRKAMAFEVGRRGLSRRRWRPQ